MNQQLSARRQGGGAALHEQPALGHVPIVENIRQQNDVAIGGDGIGEHVPGNEFRAI